jgi:hypothetical protein
MEITLKHSEYEHNGYVHEWGFNDKYDWVPKIYKCKECGELSEGPFPEAPASEVDHSKCEYDPCFSCKARSLQLGVGDAGRSMSARKWDAELNAYSAARKQGIQPAGTTMNKVEEALKLSDKAGKAFDANTNSFKG